jgi:hypothetical protein
MRRFSKYRWALPAIKKVDKGFGVWYNRVLNVGGKNENK